MTGTAATRVRGTGWLEFPFQSIVARRSFEQLAARFVWLSLPLEYFILTQFPGGVGGGLAPIVVVALITIMAMVAISCITAFVQARDGQPYPVRIRVWTVTLMLQWVMTLALLAAGYVIGRRLDPTVNNDVVYLVLRGVPSWNSYPAIFDPRTFAVYTCYSFLAAILIRMAARFLGKKEFKEDSPRGPNLLVVVPLTAAIMMVMHGLTRLH